MGLSLRKSGNLPTSISINNSTRFGIFNSGERPLLMDLYGIATAAYSLRKLRRKYTGPAIRARKQVSSSDVYEEIGFDSSGNLDTTSLTTFALNADNGDVFVQTWYDQSGNNNHATQNTHTAQPKIVDAGVLVTENGKVALDFDGNDYLSLTSSIVTNIDYTGFQVTKRAITSSRSITMIGDSIHGSYLAWIYTDNKVYFKSSRGFVSVSLNTVNQVLLTSLNVHSGNMTIYSNGQSIVSTSPTIGASVSMDTIGKRQNEYGVGNTQEIIIYNSDKSALRTDIEDNINGYYDIYTP